MSNIEIVPVGYAAGAEVRGIDARRPLGKAELKSVYDAWLKHVVLVFPGQDGLAAEQLLAFSRNFGTLDDHKSQPPAFLHDNHREILVVTNRMRGNKQSGTRNSGRNWHTDLSYSMAPAKGALMLCVERPPVGGDTMFANMTIAYETLSPRMRAIVDEMEAVHDSLLIKGIEKRDPADIAELRKRNPPVIHPMVRVHPETGRRSLLVGQRISGIVGMADHESTAILKLLNDHATSPEFVYRHRWRVGDIVMWDNRCSAHVALADFDQTKPRYMLRCSLEGEATGRIAEPAATEERESLLQAVAAAA